MLNMFKRCKYLALILVLTSCSHFNPTCPGNPYQAQPYIENVYTCSDIAADYSRHLNACGYDTHVIVGDVFGLPDPHAWVEITEGNQTYYIDPTWQIGCFPASQWTDRVAEWRYNRNITGFEVKAYQKKEKY